jgi:hypothetical protein
MAPIDDALAALQSLPSGERPNLTQVAKKYGCNRTTLSKRWRGFQAQEVESQQFLDDTQQSELLLYIEGLTSKGILSTRQMVCNFASDVAGRPADKHRVDRFIKRHRVDLLSSWIDLNESDHSSATASTNSALSAKDGRKTERLVRPMVADTYGRRLEELSQNVDTLVACSKLFLHDINQLREAVLNGSKKRKRGKTPPRVALSRDDGDTISWSAQKGQEAPSHHDQKNAKNKAPKHQNEKFQFRSEAQKAEKARMLEERKRTKGVAKEFRLKDRDLKESRKLGRELSQSRKKEPKSKGISRAITPHISKGEKASHEEPSRQDSVLKKAAPSPVRRLRNRDINLH